MKYNTAEVLKIFDEIAKIPRTSGNEASIGKWLAQWAEENGFSSKTDQVGNVLIEVPATSDLEDKEGFILQSHMDIVGQKDKECDHDFQSDPIIPKVEGDWLRSSKRTTLGADNGIGIAAALALAISTEPHPKLEILVTVDEETGLTGALKLQKGFVTQKKLINLDSEEIGGITIGCAGSQDLIIRKQFELESIGKDTVVFEAEIKGGKGGHSGVDIHKKIANANKLLQRFLSFTQRETSINLISLQGGNVRNGIAVDSRAIFVVDALSERVVKDSYKAFYESVINGEYNRAEPKLKFELKQTTGSKNMLSNEDTTEVLSLLALVPHGVNSMSEAVEGLVESSNNLAIVSLEKGTFEIICMARSSVVSKIEEIKDVVKAASLLVGADYEEGNASPPWQPDPESRLAAKAKEVYESVTGNKAQIESIHAGLECGVIGAPYGEMEMISIGPDIKGAHTPDERLYIPSLETFLRWLSELLRA